MLLTKDEGKILDGELGEGKQKAMQILKTIGEIYDADRLIPVTSAQVAGVSYKTIGDAGLEFLEDFAAKGARASIPAFLNPAGMDLKNWEEMGIPRKFAEMQLKVMKAYASMGISATCTCTPYLIGIRPKRGEHIAWSESSAISFANSMLGARTNRESAVTALASAVIGKTPNFGLHLNNNRVASVVFEIKAGMSKLTDFGALGIFAGRLAKERIPAFEGMNRSFANEDRMKSLGAAMAASGSVALYYAKGITPEWVVPAGIERVPIEQKQLDEMKAKMQSADSVDLVTIGCPHCSLQEIKEIAWRLKGKKLKMKLWVCTSGKVKEQADKEGYSAAIREAGGLVVADTCMVVAPIEQMGFKSTGANSGKAAIYLQSLCRQKVSFKDVEELL